MPNWSISTFGDTQSTGLRRHSVFRSHEHSLYKGLDLPLKMQGSCPMVHELKTQTIYFKKQSKRLGLKTPRGDTSLSAQPQQKPEEKPKKEKKKK
ncbi:MAG: hypothetical protein DSO08_05795 [Candidatus Methanomethylicota archaeon]|uniref:Uncharacterized protein n=1 Tax=Thermoproteota archaeon TaxID=2056631 RepID=A0A523B996_9CREN|nr:MAG: hypothetical protein DSO08_05795 [Candidatus Verstraetearchaeota archaeon]